MYLHKLLVAIFAKIRKRILLLEVKSKSLQRRLQELIDLPWIDDNVNTSVI